MILSKNKLLYSILAFMLLIDILVAFNLNQFYIRAVLAFLFITLIPGLLIMLMMKIREAGFWEYLVYTIGLSIAFIMFAGLAVNWILPWLHITDKPLSTWPILICFNIFLIAFWIIAYLRNSDLKYKISLPKLDTFNTIMFIIPMFFPVLAILGAFILNNHGPNYLTMIMIGGIAIYVFCIVLFRKKLNPNIYPWAIWMMSIALLMSGWLRSWYVSGVDINLEYSIFQETIKLSKWTPSLVHSVYNSYKSMLSITILPTILYSVTKINNQFIFKVFIPLVFSFVPLIIFLISKKYFKGLLCFLATFFFMSQPAFVNWSWIPIKQEIAFIFFSLMLLVLFSKDIKSTLKNFLFLIFGFSMIVSHYSTAYIALAIFTLTYLLIFLYKKYEKRKIRKGRLNEKDKQQFYLTGILILLLLIFGFVWYSQLTETSDGLIDFTHKSTSNLGNMFSEDVQIKGESPLNQFNLFGKQKNYQTELGRYTGEYTKEIITNYPSTNLYDSEKYKSYTTNLRMAKGILYKFNSKTILIIFYIGEFLKVFIGKVLIVMGVIFLFFSLRKNKKNLEYLSVIISCFFMLCLIIILPFTTIRYDLMRVYQQILIILSISVIFGALFVFKFLKEKWKFFCTILLLLFYFFFLSNLIPQIIGGANISMKLNNFGGEYDIYFTHLEEISSGKWIEENYRNQGIYLDDHASNKMFLSNRNTIHLIKDVLPSIISRKSYVGGSYANVVNKIAFKNFKGITLNFNFPTEFLNDNKNRIYNNGGSEIFK